MKQFIVGHGGQELSVLYKRGEETNTLYVTPKEGIIDGAPAIGITTDFVGTVKLGFFGALKEGFLMTIGLVTSTVVGLVGFIISLMTGVGSLSQITGPVGIVGMVGEAANFGFIYLLSFTAFISINLAVINFIPFPALDGGRLLFILIEAVLRRNIKPAVVN